MSSLEEIIDTEGFRDEIATVDSKGKRVWIYPKKPKGSLHNKRVIVSIILLTLFFVTPFIWVNGHPLFMFNLFERKFIIFGQLFVPQDFYLFAIALITGFVFIILFTVVYGRVFCGWICPQTIFMEMVFRKIEYWIEGNANQQRKLNARPWDSEKIRKKSLKFGAFMLVSVIVSHWLLMYLVGWDKALAIVTQSPTNNISGFIAMVVFTFIFYGVFSTLREQACVAICPYGRLQGVLLGKDSIAVSYDFKRGEPRGKLKRKKKKEDIKTRPLTVDDLVQEENTQGDCIDCKLCVHVCPTGIDIRNGNQMECVNCTACIDVCDEVMDKIKKPRGLIRFASHNNIEHRTKFKFTARILAYSGVLLVLLSVLGLLLIRRGSIDISFVRKQSTTFTITDDHQFINYYQATFINKGEKDIYITKATVPKIKGAKVIIPGNEFVLKAGDSPLVRDDIMIFLPEEFVTSNQNITIQFWSKDKKLVTIRTNFLGIP